MAFCNGCGACSVPSPSTVVTSRPSTVAARTMHEFAGSPSSQTVHAPQLPCSHPNVGLVTLIVSRRNVSRLVCTGAAPLTFFPLSLKWMVILLMGLALLAQAAGAAQDTRRQHLGELPPVPGGPLHIVDGLDLGHGLLRRCSDRLRRELLAAQQRLGLHRPDGCRCRRSDRPGHVDGDAL